MRRCSEAGASTAQIGRVTRDHGDIELWVDRREGHHVQRLLVDAGAIILDTQPREESRSTTGTAPGCAPYFDAQPDGTFTTKGRFDDWVFPVGSFPDELVALEGTPLRAMSVVGMLAMKEQYPHLRNGRPWRDKDLADVRILRSMLGDR